MKGKLLVWALLGVAMPAAAQETAQAPEQEALRERQAAHRGRRLRRSHHPHLPRQAAHPGRLDLGELPGLSRVD